MDFDMHAQMEMDTPGPSGASLSNRTPVPRGVIDMPDDGEEVDQQMRGPGQKKT